MMGTNAPASHEQIRWRMAEIGNEITRRYQEKRMPVALYQRAFGDDVPVPEQFLTRVP